jgi:hypothetical protein
MTVTVKWENPCGSVMIPDEGLMGIRHAQDGGNVDTLLGGESHVTVRHGDPPTRVSPYGTETFFFPC